VKNNYWGEVCPGIFRITERGFLSILKPPVHIYVITGPNGLIFDAGYGDFVSIKKFSRAYKQITGICRERGIENHIDRILPSHAHADHFSGLKKLRQKSGFRILITVEMHNIIKSGIAYRNSFAPPDAELKKKSDSSISRILRYIKDSFEFTVYSLYWGITFVDNPDVLISPETEININGEIWEIFKSPGHSSEHITLYNKERGIIFSGDNVLNSINVWLGPPKSDLEQYENSLKEMLDLPGLKIILPAHGSPIKNPYQRLNEIIEWRRKRTADVSGIVREAGRGGISLREILEILYPSGSKMKKEFASGWVKLTLDKLEHEKKIVRDNNRYSSSARH